MTTRLLIRGDNWRFRYDIAFHGTYPTWRYRDEKYVLQGTYNSEEDAPQRLPDSGMFGYPIAYLEVGASDPLSLQPQRTKGQYTGWEWGENTLCAECAENAKPDVGSDWALLPLLQMNGEITGHYDSRVFRCEQCFAIICDYETLELRTIEHDGTVESQHFYAGDLEKALEQFQRDAESGMYRAVELWDTEQFLNNYVTGDSAEPERIRVYATDHATLASLTQPHIPGIAPYVPGQLRLFHS